jgi:hypothetical protein
MEWGGRGSEQKGGIEDPATDEGHRWSGVSRPGATSMAGMPGEASQGTTPPTTVADTTQGAAVHGPGRQWRAA